MNYIILDTEKTYNIGWVVISSDKKSNKLITEREYIINSNFENRLICGEINYNRKKKYFNEHPDANRKIVANPIEVLTQLSADIKKYEISIIIGNQISEDRIQIGNLINDVKGFCSFDNSILSKVEWLDLQKMTKCMLDTNQTNLEDLINDILGEKFVQTHTALEDAKLCWNLLEYSAQYIPLFSTSNTADGSIDFKAETSNLIFRAFSGRNQLLSAKEIFNVKPSDSFTVKSITTVCRNMVKAKWFIEKTCPQYSEKTGNLLKTPVVKYEFTPLGLEMRQLWLDFNNTKWIELFEKKSRDVVIDQTPMLSEFKLSLEKEFKAKNNQLDNDIKKFNNTKAETTKKLQQLEIDLNQKYKDKEQALQNAYNNKLKELNDLYEAEVDKVRKSAKGFFSWFKIKSLKSDKFSQKALTNK